MNLLTETIQALHKNWKTEEDVEYVLWSTVFDGYDNNGYDNNWEIIYNTWEWFIENSNFTYYDWYWSQKIEPWLMVVWKDFWLERREYDWGEWWQYKETPSKPKKKWIIIFIEQ